MRLMINLFHVSTRSLGKNGLAVQLCIMAALVLRASVPDLGLVQMSTGPQHLLKTMHAKIHWTTPQDTPIPPPTPLYLTVSSLLKIPNLAHVTP